MTLTAGMMREFVVFVFYTEISRAVVLSLVRCVCRRDRVVLPNDKLSTAPPATIIPSSSTI